MNGVSVSPEGYTLSIDMKVYALEIIKKTAYRFANKASVIIKNADASTAVVIFNFVGQNATNNPEQVISDFCNELLDQDLREIVKRETGALRNALIAHAFSRTSLTEQG